MLAIARNIAVILGALAPLTACVAEPEAEIEDRGGGGKEDSPDVADNPTLPSGDPASYPIVLVHGFNASPTKNGFGPEVVRALCDDGHSVYAPALPPFASVATRSAVLARAIDDALAGVEDACGAVPASGAPAKVNLIAHSMGGLDSRAVVATLGYGDRVASITTISTPHHGSAVADMSLGLLSAFDDDALRALGSLMGRTLSTDPTALAPDLRAAFTALTESGAAAFNAANPDDPRVRYESWAGLSNVAGIPNPQDGPACEWKMSLFNNPLTSRHRMHVALKPIAKVVAHGFSLRPNDGLVQIASAKWATFRGCIPADHADEVGAFPFRQFDHVRFLRNRAFELAATGF
jgi:triacylglycerol lipase